MTATAHALLGTLIAVRFIDPYAAVPIAIGSHYLTDIVPHWDSGTNLRKKSEKRFVVEGIVDATIAFFVSGFTYYIIFGLTDFIYLYMIVFCALLPDIVTMITRFVLHIKSPLWNWNNRLQSVLNQRLQLPWGILTQVIVIGVAYIFFFRVFV